MIGVIVASFMLGLVLGAAFILRKLERLRSRQAAFAGAELGLGVFVVFIGIVFVALNAWRTDAHFFIVQVLFPFLTVCSGFWVGLIFPLANSLYAGISDSIGATAGKLYGADLLGACLGALFTATFLVPVLGLIQTAFFIGALCFLGAVFLAGAGNLSG
jgi:spermidine synthase